MSAPMVCAILDGRKTQTRRIIKPQPESTPGMDCTRVRYKNRRGDVVLDEALESQRCCQELCPHGVPGDRLWVRENFQPLLAEGVDWRDADYETGTGYAVNYVATGGVREFVDCANDDAMSSRITPCIFMPRWASRITLEITEVRVQRLQDISEGDVEAEGLWRGRARRHLWWLNPTDCRLAEPFPSHRAAYQYLWESINGNGSWDVNPWVWAIAF